MQSSWQERLIFSPGNWGLSWMTVGQSAIASREYSSSWWQWPLCRFFRALMKVTAQWRGDHSQSLFLLWPNTLPKGTLEKEGLQLAHSSQGAVVYNREGRARFWRGSQVRAFRLLVCIQEGEHDTCTHAHVCTHTDKERSERDRDRESDRNEKWDYVIKLQNLLPSHIHPPSRLYLRTSYCSPTVLPTGTKCLNTRTYWRQHMWVGHISCLNHNHTIPHLKYLMIFCCLTHCYRWGEWGWAGGSNYFCWAISCKDTLWAWATYAHDLCLWSPSKGRDVPLL